MFNSKLKKRVAELERQIEVLASPRSVPITKEQDCNGCRVKVGERDSTVNEIMSEIGGYGFFGSRLYTKDVTISAREAIELIIAHLGIKFKHTPESTQTKDAKTVITKKPVKKPATKKK